MFRGFCRGVADDIAMRVFVIPSDTLYVTNTDAVDARAPRSFHAPGRAYTSGNLNIASASFTAYPTIQTGTLVVVSPRFRVVIMFLTGAIRA